MPWRQIVNAPSGMDHHSYRRLSRPIDTVVLERETKRRMCENINLFWRRSDRFEWCGRCGIGLGTENADAHQGLVSIMLIM
jgi:hypothetical protein